MAPRVIYPRGLPETPEWRVACQELVRCCGGSSRILVAPRSDEEARTNARIWDFLSADDEPPLVVLAARESFSHLIAVRKELELAVPRLQRARWVVFVGAKFTPALIAEASELGMVEGSGVDGPLWLTRGGSYLVLTTDLRQPDGLPLRIQALDATAELSRRRPGIGTGYSERPPAPSEAVPRKDRLSQRACAPSSPCLGASQDTPGETGLDAPPRSEADGSWDGPLLGVLDDEPRRTACAPQGPSFGDYEDDGIPESAVIRSTLAPATDAAGACASPRWGNGRGPSRQAASGARQGRATGSVRLTPPPRPRATPGVRKR